MLSGNFPPIGIHFDKKVLSPAVGKPPQKTVISLLDAVYYSFDVDSIFNHSTKTVATYEREAEVYRSVMGPKLFR